MHRLYADPLCTCVTLLRWHFPVVLPISDDGFAIYHHLVGSTQWEIHISCYMTARNTLSVGGYGHNAAPQQHYLKHGRLSYMCIQYNMHRGRPVENLNKRILGGTPQRVYKRLDSMESTLGVSMLQRKWRPVWRLYANDCIATAGLGTMKEEAQLAFKS